jgi:hypothetical protein
MALTGISPSEHIAIVREIDCRLAAQRLPGTVTVAGPLTDLLEIGSLVQASSYRYG